MARIKTKGAKRGRDEPTYISGDNETNEPPSSHNKGGAQSPTSGRLTCLSDTSSLNILCDSSVNTAKQPDKLDGAILIRPLFIANPWFLYLLGSLRKQFL